MSEKFTVINSDSSNSGNIEKRLEQLYMKHLARNWLQYLSIVIGTKVGKI